MLEYSAFSDPICPVMRQEGLTEVLTGDRHLLQAGFTLLMESE